jgi:large subunit ribosomal protein L21
LQTNIKYITMFAIVEIAGLQYKVEQDQTLFVNRLKGEIGSKVTFDTVLLTSNSGTIVVGAPAVTGISVEAEILRDVKADKVIIFKKKRRKGYQKKNGHRQSLTQIRILSITGFAPGAKSEKPASAKKSKTAGDDLTIVEGIGPKVAELFNAAGIATLAQLATKSEADLKAILEPKGGIYATMEPATWPKQAELAAAGKFDELKKWQDELNGGK